MSTSKQPASCVQSGATALAAPFDLALIMLNLWDQVQLALNRSCSAALQFECSLTS